MYAIGDIVKLVKVDPLEWSDSPGYVKEMRWLCDNNMPLRITELPNANYPYVYYATPIDEYDPNRIYPNNWGWTASKIHCILSYEWIMLERWITPYIESSQDIDISCIATTLEAICSL